MQKLVIGRMALCAAIASLAACGDSGSSATSGASAAPAAGASVAINSSTGSKQITTPSSTTLPSKVSSSATTASSTSSTPPAASSGTSSAPSTATVATATPVPSTLKMSAASYSVMAAAGTAVLTVERVGSKGATAVQYTTANGTGTSGVDYTSATGTLSWADGDTSIKKILVPVGPKASGKTFRVALASSSSNATVASPNAATVTIVAPINMAPPAAELAGYTQQTFGPSLTMNDNWYDMTFFGWKGVGGADNSDGTVTIAGTGVGSISTAAVDSTKPNHWKGVAFGGGAYFEATFSFEGANTEKLSPRWPAFWADDIECTATPYATAQTQWQGEASGFRNCIETDFFEYDIQKLDQYGIQLHNWYGINAKDQIKDTRAWTSAVHVPAGFKWSDTHKYGFLWVPATDSAKGYAQAYLDDVPMGKPVYWNKYDPSAPPSPALGSTAFSVMDSRHMAIIMDTGPQNPMTIHSVSVWQQSDANNIKQ